MPACLERSCDIRGRVMLAWVLAACALKGREVDSRGCLRRACTRETGACTSGASGSLCAGGVAMCMETCLPLCCTWTGPAQVRLQPGILPSARGVMCCLVVGSGLLLGPSHAVMHSGPSGSLFCTLCALCCILRSHHAHVCPGKRACMRLRSERYTVRSDVPCWPAFVHVVLASAVRSCSRLLPY